MSRPGNKLTALKNRSKERSRVVEHVRAALPPRLAQAVVSAGIDQNRLTIGVAGSVWASRIRYFTVTVQKAVASSLAVEISGVRIRVVQPIT